MYSFFTDKERKVLRFEFDGFTGTSGQICGLCERGPFINHHIDKDTQNASAVFSPLTRILSTDLENKCDSLIKPKGEEDKVIYPLTLQLKYLKIVSIFNYYKNIQCNLSLL